MLFKRCRPSRKQIQQIALGSSFWRNLASEILQQNGSKSRNTLLAALKACCSTRNLKRGKEIHALAVESRNDSCIYVATALVNMYSKCGNMVEARQVFDCMKRPDVVSWTALIMGYAENGEGSTALEVFSKMKSQGCTPNSITFVAAIKACTSLAQKQDGTGMTECRERGRQIHLEIGSHLNNYVQSTLVDMYANCGRMAEARQVFLGIKQPNVVSWTALILGYAENGEGVTALDLFTRMKSQGCVPDSITFIAVLKACGLLGAMEYGRKIHAEIDAGSEWNSILVTCLVDFYAKCGSLVEAQFFFDSHPSTRDLRTWTALLAGYSRLGDNNSVFGLFERMQDAGFWPNGVTFLCILTCCSHVGLVEKANDFFQSMITKYGITPTAEHCNCMVDMLGRSNKMNDAIALLQRLPCKPNAVTWMTILGACRKWKNIEIGRLAFKSLVTLDDTNSAAYVLMGHIYGSRGMWKEQEMVLGMRKKCKAWKEPGQSWWTNELGEVHTFVVGESKHPQIYQIQEKLKAMVVVMRKHGYISDLLSVSHNITNAEKEEALCGHSEKLAIVCALLNTSSGRTVRIVKNLRVCDDCHAATALISELESRTIICRDASRFHIFKDGKCSCGEFW